MTRVLGIGTFVAIACGAISVMGQQGTQRPTFRALTSLVTVETMVFDGNKLVPGLTPKDFIVEDNGVRQDVEMMDVESLPIDLTLVVDTSGSVEPMQGQLRLYARSAVQELRVDDRFRLITFAGEVRDVFGLKSPADDVPVSAIVADGATSIYDATMASLMRTRRGDRRQIVVLFTDGIDTNSFEDVKALEAVAKRSDSVLYIYIVKDAMGMPVPGGQASRYLDTRRYWLSRMEQDLESLGAAARATGGWLDDVYVRAQLPGRLKQTLEDFRTSYVLRYRPANVEPGGWHAITVRVADTNRRVRARSGYFWGN